MNGHPHVGPDRSMLGRFVGALFRHADEGTIISLRAFDDDRQNERPIFIDGVRVDDDRLLVWMFNRAKQAAEHDKRANFCPPLCTFVSRDKADEAAIANGVVLSVDCDAHPDASRRKLAALLGEPTIVSASGGEWTNSETGEVEPKLHLHWRLTEPTRDAEGHTHLKEARRLACYFVGADASGVPLNHPLRWPGSVHRKGEPRLAHIVSQTENEIELADVLEKLRAACPDAPQRDTRARAAGAGFGFAADLRGNSIDIAHALVAIPNDDMSWDAWNRIAMATWAASDGKGYVAFDAWSQQSTKYDRAVTADRWGHLGRYPPTNIGAGTLYHLAREASPGWRKPSGDTRAEERDQGAPDEPPGGDEKPKGKAKASRSRKAPPPRDQNDIRPVIRLMAGELSKTVDQAEDALIAANCGVFQRGGLIVGVGVTPMLTAHRKTIATPSIFEMGEHRLLELMMDAAAFEKWDARADGFVPTSAPMMIPKTLRERRGKLRLPVLSGIINAPTMRDDGSLIESPGYDGPTGLLYDPAGTVFPPVPARPTQQQVHSSLELIEALIADFPFVGDADRSVALAGILTSVCRKALMTAPAFAYTATVAGSGKSMLVDLMSIITTGKEAGVIAIGSNPEEAEKRVASLLLGGNAVAIDNVEGGFGGELLCQLMTQATVRMRVLGRSETPEMPTNVMVTATGNNMTVDGDMTRRTLLCRLDPKVERPELREFAFDPIEKAKDERGALLVAALTVLRAYHVAGRPAQTTRLGSFGDWSDLVRSALMWLSRADPVGTIEQARADDPKLEKLRAVLEHWKAVIGSGASAGESTSVSANEAAKRASDQVTGTSYENYRRAFINPEFREALLAVAGSNGFIDTGKLGTWLGRNKGRVIEGMHIEAAPMLDGLKKWRLIAEDTTSEASRKASPTPEESEASHWEDSDFVINGSGRTRF